MHCRSETGRTMLETIMVIGLMGILSVGSVYMYRRAMNDVRADGMVKDVLERASQKKSNEDLNRLSSGKRVYAPEYKRYKKDGSETETTKGRYGYSYEIMEASTSALVIVQTVGRDVNSGLCRSLKSKFTAYKKNTFQKVMVVEDGKETTDILTEDCPKDIPTLRFYVEYGDRAGGAVKPAPVVPKPGEECPAKTSTGGFGDRTGIYKGGLECRCIRGTAHWTGSECVVCASIQTWNPDTKMCEPPLICPPNSSTSGEGDNTDVEGCICDEPFTHWNGTECVCPTALPSIGEVCNVSCGCSVGSCEDGTCACSAPLPGIGEACYAACGCLVGSCEDGRCACPAPLPGIGGACDATCGCSVGSCEDGRCACPAPLPGISEACYAVCGCSVGSCEDGTCACPAGTSSTGTGDETNIAGCKCEEPLTHWNGLACTCPDGTDENMKEDGTKECCLHNLEIHEHCNKDCDCAPGLSCENNECKKTQCSTEMIVVHTKDIAEQPVTYYACMDTPLLYEDAEDFCRSNGMVIPLGQWVIPHTAGGLWKRRYQDFKEAFQKAGYDMGYYYSSGKKYDRGSGFWGYALAKNDTLRKIILDGASQQMKNLQSASPTDKAFPLCTKACYNYRSTSECGEGHFCYMRPINGINRPSLLKENDYKEGQCVPLESTGYHRFHYNGHDYLSFMHAAGYTVADQEWIGAYNICKSFGMEMVTLQDAYCDEISCSTKGHEALVKEWSKTDTIGYMKWTQTDVETGENATDNTERVYMAHNSFQNYSYSGPTYTAPRLGGYTGTNPGGLCIDSHRICTDNSDCESYEHCDIEKNICRITR